MSIWCHFSPALSYPSVALNPRLQREATTAVNGCRTNTNCPAFIPTWVQPQRREAVQQVFRAITTL
jgi:hypothetical protein